MEGGCVECVGAGKEGSGCGTFVKGQSLYLIIPFLNMWLIVITKSELVKSLLHFAEVGQIHLIVFYIQLINVGS